MRGAPGYPSTVGRILTRTARRLPDKLALTFADRRWTYAELDRAAGRVAAGLSCPGLKPGDRVAAFGKNSDAYLLLYLGCARAGLVHVPVNFNARRDELAYLLTQSEPRAVFIDPSLAEARRGGRARRLGASALGTLRDGDTDNDVLSWALDGDGPVHEEDGVARRDLVQLLYTSGTTSQAKGAMLTHRALVHEYVSAARRASRSRGATCRCMRCRSITRRRCTCSSCRRWRRRHQPPAEAPDLDEILDARPRDGIDSLFFPPTVWVGVANHPAARPRPTSAACARRSTAPRSCRCRCSQRLQARLPDAGFYNCFGQSEIGPLATVLRPEEHAARPDSVGRAVLFVETRVVDPEMNDVAAGEVGEVVYRSPQLCAGYWGKPEETAEAFRGGWFHSGDLCRIDAEGYLFVVDRIKDVINTGGVLVASREVEDALYAHEAVAEVAVVGLPHERWIEAIAAVVVVKRPVDAEELIAFARERLAAHKVPKSVHFVDALPKNASGKLLKRELRDQLSVPAAAS